jgi:hypothetical protein
MSSMTSELTHEQRLARTGIALPDALPAFGQYVPAMQHGTNLWVGRPLRHPPGRIPPRRTVRARRHRRRGTRRSPIRCHQPGGDGARHPRITRPVELVVQVYGVVNATPDFVEHTSVIDAASDVLVEVFGDAGRHTRLAVGVASLPANLVLEIQALLIVTPEPVSYPATITDGR